MKTNYILPHLGMGDYLLCNGLIRNLIKRYPDEPVILFTNIKLKQSIKFMLRDIPNLEFVTIPPVEWNGRYILPFINKHPYHIDVIGYENLDTTTTSDKSFYKQFGLNFEQRWSDFYVERDLEREKALEKKLGIDTNSDYIFIHEDPSRDQFINPDHIKNRTFKIISAKDKVTDNIFDYCGIIENANEIHCIESSFLFLIDSIETKATTLCSHRHARELYEYTVPNMKKDWNILT